jgi:SAM-dependent methyltransferase
MTQSEATAPAVGPPQVPSSAREHLDGSVETAERPWEYAWQAALSVTGASDGDTLAVTVDVHVLHGTVGVGIVAADGSTFLVERPLNTAVGHERIVLRADPGQASSLIVRNVHEGGSSRFRVAAVHARLIASSHNRYPISVAYRDFAAEAPPAGGRIVFDDDVADAINVARMACIRRLGLPFEGRRVLDVGAGIGHFSRLYSSMGASVVAIEGRPDNVAELRARYPEVDAHIGDVQDTDLTRLGPFDAVHAFGLLYHLDSPVAALRRIERVCSHTLLLETMVCDAKAPVMLLADETKSVNQALAGLGCRPSPSFVAMALNRIGFRYVYGAAVPPEHPDFQFEWRNDLSIRRDGHNLRCVFVASRSAIISDALVTLMEP